MSLLLALLGFGLIVSLAVKGMSADKQEFVLSLVFLCLLAISAVGILLELRSP